MTRALQPGPKTPTSTKKDDTATTVVTKALSPVTTIAPVLKPAERQGIARQRTPEVSTETERKVNPKAYAKVRSSVPSLRKAVETIAFADLEGFENADLSRAEDKRKEKIESGKQEDTSTQYETGIGKIGTVKETTKIRTGAKRETAELSADYLAGARAAAKTLLVSSDDELAASVKFLAQAGAFGTAETKYDVKQGRHALTLSTKASGGAGAQVTGGAAARIDLLVPALVAVFEVTAQVGAWGELKSSAEYTYRQLQLKLQSELKGFAGAMAEVKGEFTASQISGLGLSGEAKAKAGVEGEAKTTGTIGIKDVGELEFELGVLGFAGAEASAEGKAKISLTGVAVSASVSAFAGAKATVTGSGTVKLRGREVLKVKGEASVEAGVGGEAKFAFEFSHGKLMLSGDIGAALGLGAEVGAELEIDFEALAEAILGLIADQWNKEELKIDTKGLDYLRENLVDPAEIKAKQEAGYKAVIDGFDDYASEVLALAKKNKLTGTQVLKPARIQEVIQDAAGQLDRRYKETDQGIMSAAQDAFGELLAPGGLVVDGLVVRGVQSITPKDAQAASAKHDTLDKVTKSRGALKRALLIYANSSRAAKGAAGITQAQVQKIVTANWKAIQEAYPGAEAKYAVVALLTETLSGFLGTKTDGTVDATVDDKGTVKFGKDEAALTKLAKGEKEAFAQAASQQKANAAYAALAAELKQYKAGLLASDKAKLSGAEIAKIVAKHAAQIPTDQPKDAVKQALQKAVQTQLDPFVMTVEIGDDRTVKHSAYDLDKLTAAQKEAAKERRKTAHDAELDTLERAITTKRETLLKSDLKPGDFLFQLVKFAAKPMKTCATNLGRIEGAKDLTPFSKEIEATLNRALAPLAEVKVAGDTALPFKVADAGVFKEEQRKVKAQVKGGTSSDNERRALVAKALREDFGTYGNQLRAALQQQVEGGKTAKTPPAGVDKAKLQSIIKARTKAIEADVKNPTGDAAVVDAAANAFGLEGRQMPGPFLLKKFSVKDLEIDQFEAAKLADLATGKKAESKAVADEDRVMAALAKEVEAYAVKLASTPGAVPSRFLLQGLINRIAVGGLAHSTPEEWGRLDAVVIVAMSKGFGEKLAKFDAKRGVITEFETIGGQDMALLAAEREKLTKVIAQYATNCTTSGDVPKQDIVQKNIDAYRDKVKGVKGLNAKAEDAAVADAVGKGLGGLATLLVRGGKITMFDVRKPVKGKGAKR